MKKSTVIRVISVLCVVVLCISAVSCSGFLFAENEREPVREECSYGESTTSTGSSEVTSVGTTTQTEASTTESTSSSTSASTSASTAAPDTTTTSKATTATTTKTTAAATTTTQSSTKPVLKNAFSSQTDSVLISQVGYSAAGFKAAYIRSTSDPGTGNYYAEFAVVRKSDNQKVYNGKAYYWGKKWDTYWWTADFSDFTASGEYYVAFYGKNETLTSTEFKVGEKLLTNEAIEKVLFDQLDQRRNEDVDEIRSILSRTGEFKNPTTWDGQPLLGWRDSSSIALREIHANVIALQTLCDVYDMMYDELSEENKARLIDNIKFGCTYILALQEKTDDPMTSGRFKHDLYDTVYSAPKIRNLYDALNGMYILARCYGVMKNFDTAEANKYKEAFDLTYGMLELRPYYLDEEFALETPQGREYMSSIARMRYNITSFSWEWPNTMRTRDRMLYMKGCVEMYKVTKDAKYLAKAEELGAAIADRQVTNESEGVEGCYGMFMEFDNSNAIMIDWMQDLGFNVACQQPTDLEPFIELIKAGSANSDRWQSVIDTYVDGYVKRTEQLTPLGIYPVNAVRGAGGGVKFFSSIAHGANGLYGLSARNIAILGMYLQDSSLRDIAQQNLQFLIGLNPGIPNGYKATKWTSQSFIYGIGLKQFTGTVGGNRSTPLAIGSGFNGFSATGQFAPASWYSDIVDRPSNIYDANGNIQFNEDYLPIGMAYVSAVIYTEHGDF